MTDRTVKLNGRTMTINEFCTGSTIGQAVMTLFGDQIDKILGNAFKGSFDFQLTITLTHDGKSITIPGDKVLESHQEGYYALIRNEADRLYHEAVIGDSVMEKFEELREIAQEAIYKIQQK